MKPKLLFIIVLATPLMGCGIGGFWMNGNPHIKYNVQPALASWKKIGASKSQVMQASFECGGCNCDHGPNIGSQDVAKKKNADESYMQTYWRIAYEWERCMVEKGYSYVGACETEYAKAGPGCRARQASNVIAPRD